MTHIAKKYELEEIASAAKWLLEQIGDRKVIALDGNMGAGKTTLVNAVCQLMHVSDTSSSPTFSIINEYRYNQNGKEDSMYHIDLYRLKSEQEAIQAGVEDCIYSGNYCFVEWPQRAPGLFPTNTVYVRLKQQGDKGRLIEIELN